MESHHPPLILVFDSVYRHRSRWLLDHYPEVPLGAAPFHPSLVAGDGDVRDLGCGHNRLHQEKGCPTPAEMWARKDAEAAAIALRRAARRRR